ncbi:hypothetical protein DL770_002133 [Monosporascus sp. CRB-9-2]|nr:hypothetical protein DL770_002133 [Monosporascus sp. CRB-9-2]
MNAGLQNFGPSKPFAHSHSKSKRSRLYTQAAPASAAPSTLPPFPDASPSLSYAHRQPDGVRKFQGYGLDVSKSLSSAEWHRPDDDGATEEPDSWWDGTLKKFVPRPRNSWQEIVKSPRATTARDLKAKIMGAFGDYRVVHQDLMHIYGLSHSETRQAVDQLEKLLWGWSRSEAAVRLDNFHLWKRDFGRHLQIISQNITDSEPQTQGLRIGPWTSLTKEDSATINAAWQRLDQKKREQMWPQMVASALTSNPGILPTFIQVTFDPDRCPNYILEDVVYLLFRSLKSLQSSKERENQVAELVMFLLERCPPRYLVFDQHVLHETIRLLDPNELVHFYEAVKQTEHPLHSNTLLHIASRFAKSSAHKVNAADVICSLTEIPGFDINAPAPASVCTSLLTLGESDPFPEGPGEPDELFKVLLERGFRPNLLGLTALMRNFCVRGHLDTAWKIFDLLLQHNFEPDAHVFSILLNGSKNSFDIPSTRKLIEIVFSRGAWTEVIVDEFLHLMFLHNEAQPEERRRQRKANNAWRPMLQVFSKFYKLAPLQRFFTFPLENIIASRDVLPRHETPITNLAAALRPQPEHMLMKPTSNALLLLLAAHARSINHPVTISLCWRRLHFLIGGEDPVAVRLIKEKGTMIYDIYIRALMQFQETLWVPMRILRHMIVNAEKEKTATGGNIRHPFPSVHTWTTLLNGFKNHKHVGGALSVLRMMVELGNIQPNLVTWNALIKAFARVGDVRGAVRAMRLLEQAGFSSDDRTVEAFSILPRERREEAIRLLEESRQEPIDLADPGAALGGVRARQETRRPLGLSLAVPSSNRISTRPRPVGALQPPPPGLEEHLDKARQEWDRHVAEIDRRRRASSGNEFNTSYRLNDRRPLGSRAGHPSPRPGATRRILSVISD